MGVFLYTKNTLVFLYFMHMIYLNGTRPNICVVIDYLRDLRERDLREPLRDLRDLRLGASACLERRRAPPENDPFLDPRDLREP